jgi:hypothetical protein
MAIYVDLTASSLCQCVWVQLCLRMCVCVCVWVYIYINIHTYVYLSIFLIRAFLRLLEGQGRCSSESPVNGDVTRRVPNKRLSGTDIYLAK